MRAIHRFWPLTAFAALIPPATAAEPEADPAIYVDAFNESCRRGFPDLDAIAQQAVASGWTERDMKPANGVADIFSERLPRAFGKDQLMLFLTEPNGGDYKAVCQVTGVHSTRLSGSDIAAILTPSLNAGTPVPGKGDPKQDDYALWTVKPGITVQAGISVYRKRTRTISISVRQAR